MEKIYKILLFLTILVSFVYPQKTYTFTEEEVMSLFTSIKDLELKDSLNNEIIIALENQINNYITLSSNDSVMIKELQSQIKFREQYIKKIKTKWYENKYIWFGYGFLTFLIPIQLIGI